MKILRSDFKTELADLSGINSQILRSKMNTYINTGLRDISKFHDWPWLKVDDGSITLVAGTRKYNLATNFRKMADDRSVFYIDSDGTYNYLTELNDRDFKSNISDALVNRNAPQFYRIFETSNPSVLTTAPVSKIHFDPVPSAAFVSSVTTISYEYFRWIVLPTDDTHYIELPDDFLPLLKAHCLASIYENYRKSRTLAKDKMAEYVSGISQMISSKERPKGRTKKTRHVYQSNRSRMAGRSCI